MNSYSYYKASARAWLTKSAVPSIKKYRYHALVALTFLIIGRAMPRPEKITALSPGEAYTLTRQCTTNTYCISIRNTKTYPAFAEIRFENLDKVWETRNLLIPPGEIIFTDIVTYRPFLYAIGTVYDAKRGIISHVKKHRVDFGENTGEITVNFLEKYIDHE